MNLWVVFLTGLTTGGLTCLAVQGGLLATAITRQKGILPAGQADSEPRSKKRSQRAQTHQTGIQLSRDGWPVVAFLAAKLLAYTVLGLLLGWLGSAVQITPTVQAIMMIVAGLFLLATALNMLNVHPIFRYFTLQPPRALTRLVRNQAQSEKLFAPALLGLMTVFIPCGTTQGMMILAVSSGSPLWGALILFTFVLGTSPTFFVLGFAATQLRGKVQQAFAALTALLILGLGIYSVDAGLRLVDSPLAPSRAIASLLRPTTTGEVEVVNGAQELTINVTGQGYSPNMFTVESGQPIRLRLVSRETYGCALAFYVPSHNILQVLPATGTTFIELPAQQPGRVDFMCSMGMYRGVIYVRG
jgi:sulfite exporter TauE/SafE